MTALVLSWDAPPALLPAVAGTKMSTIARLHQRGFRVPPGFTVTTAVNTADDRWREAVARAYHALGSPLVAVRSSATDEDRPGRSAAGMYRTVLNVQGTAAHLAAAEESLASATSPHRSAYAGGRPAAGMAVGVMTMVRALVSGVAFSADPLGSGHLVVEAVHGPLEPLVSGLVVPHHLTLDSTDAVIVDEAGDDGAVLNLETARCVSRLTRAIAAELAADVDVEWAVDDAGVSILQARPCTRLR